MSSKRIISSLVALLLFTGAGCISFGSNTTAPGPMGVFRSSDKGETWQQVNALPTSKGVANIAGVKVYKLFTDPSDPNAIYLGSRGQGLFFTYNRGESWQRVDQLGNIFVYSVAVDPSDKCTVYVSNGTSIFKSTDCSRSWKTTYTEQRGQKIVAVTIDKGNPQVLFAALFSGSVIKSTNGGESWKAIKTFNGNLQYVISDLFTANRLYVASVDSGLARSDDGGATWHNLTDGIQNYSGALTFYRLILHPTEKNTLYWLSQYGILYSKDAGQNWNELKLLSPPGSVNIYSFAVNPKNSKEMYYVGTVLGENNASRSTFYKSVDGGTNWVTKKMPTNTVPVTLLVHPTDVNTIFMGFTIPETK